MLKKQLITPYVAARLSVSGKDKIIFFVLRDRVSVGLRIVYFSTLITLEMQAIT